MAKNKQKNEKRNVGGLQWLLFIAVPLVFAITLTLIILKVAGIDTMEYARKAAGEIPVISSVLANEKTASAATEQQKTLEEELKKKQAEIERLTIQTETDEQTIENLNQELVKLKNRFDEEAVEEEPVEEKISNIAKSFEEMDAERAAAIVSNLEQESALLVLKNIPFKERGSILEAMEPGQAASLTSLFISDTGN